MNLRIAWLIDISWMKINNSYCKDEKCWIDIIKLQKARSSINRTQNVTFPITAKVIAWSNVGWLMEYTRYIYISIYIYIKCLYIGNTHSYEPICENALDGIDSAYGHIDNYPIEYENYSPFYTTLVFDLKHVNSNKLIHFGNQCIK